MKTRLLIIIGIIFISGLIYANSAHALPFISPEYSYENAKHVVIGKVLSVEILSEPYVQKSDNIYSERFGFALYEIQVEDYLKNPLNNSTMKLLGKYTNQLQTMSYETYPYEINQRVLLYIQEIHNIPGYELIISAANSRVIPEEFSSEDVISRFEYNTSPLKQIKSGVPVEQIQCRESLILVTKHDGSPACVTPDTVSKLSERGWFHPCPNGRFNEQRSLCIVGSPGIGSDPTELSNTQFEEIKNDIESTGYDICDIRIENDKIIIDLHKFFKDSDPEKNIISNIPSSVNYEIVYHEGYSDYFINTITAHTCDYLENTEGDNEN